MGACFSSQENVSTLDEMGVYFGFLSKRIVVLWVKKVYFWGGSGRVWCWRGVDVLARYSPFLCSVYRKFHATAVAFMFHRGDTIMSSRWREYVIAVA